MEERSGPGAAPHPGRHPTTAVARLPAFVRWGPAPRAACLAVALLLPPAPGAQAAGEVRGLNSPAWLERGATRMPLSPGTSLEAGDRIVTGDGGRARLTLEEGSDVKLGENAEFSLSRFEAPQEEGGLFSGFLEVLRGAFRYTTSAIRGGVRRDVRIRVASVTAGIRGTDVWGKSTPERDIFCLIEGAAEVRRGDEAPVLMDEPLTFYIAPRNAPAEPVAPVDPAQLQRWAAETELDEAAGPLLAGGGLRLVVQSNRDRGNSAATRERLAEAGYPARIERARTASGQWHRVVIPGFADAVSGRRFAEALERRLGYSGAWLLRGPV